MKKNEASALWYHNIREQKRTSQNSHDVKKKIQDKKTAGLLLLLLKHACMQ